MGVGAVVSRHGPLRRAVAAQLRPLEWAVPARPFDSLRARVSRGLASAHAARVSTRRALHPGTTARAAVTDADCRGYSLHGAAGVADTSDRPVARDGKVSPTHHDEIEGVLS